MTDQQKRAVLEHLAEKVMGFEPAKSNTLSPLYFHEFETDRSAAIVFSLEPWQGHPNPPTFWNPFENANDALGLLEKIPDLCPVRLREGLWKVNEWMDADDWTPGHWKQRSQSGDFREAITLACYRATGGMDL